MAASIVTCPQQYSSVLEQIGEHGATTFELRRELAGAAFATTAHYDAAISKYFTTQIQGTFIYDAMAGQMFHFLGDDDVWVFINNQLAIDLSNTHRASEQYVDMNRLGLTDGEQYTLHLFHAERQTDGSHFTFTTNVLLTDALVPNITASFD